MSGLGGRAAWGWCSGWRHISTNEKGSTENLREKSHSSSKLQHFPGLDNEPEPENTNALRSSSRR